MRIGRMREKQLLRLLLEPTLVFQEDGFLDFEAGTASKNTRFINKCSINFFIFPFHCFFFFFFFLSKNSLEFGNLKIIVTCFK